MIKDYFILAFQNLKHRGLRSLLTMLGIFIGIAAVVALISLGQGLETAITGQFSSLSADRLVIQNTGTGFGPPGSTSVEKLHEDDRKIVESVSGIDILISRLIRVGKVDIKDESHFIGISSLPSNDEELEFLYSTFSFKTEEGNLLEANERGKIILGNDFKDSDHFKNIHIGSNIKIQDKSFEVAGFLEKSGTFQFNFAIFMPEADMKEIFDIDDDIDFFVVQVEDPKEIEQVASEIERKLRQDRNQDLGEEDFSVETPAQTLGPINSIINIINIIVAGIAAISLLVGGIGITNAMYTSVLERTKEIGTMKAIGAKNKDILLVFLLESALLGLLGGIIGAIIGLGLAFAAAYGANSALDIDLLQVHLSYPLLIGAVVFSSVVGILAGMIPAIQASKLRPVEALRK